jgi:hypothetical protein
MWKSLKVIQYINRIKDKNHMIISTDGEKAFDKVQHLFILSQNIISQHNNKVIYDKPMFNTLNG